MDYKKTLNLPRTSFSMKANLTAREPLIQKRWREMDIYSAIRRRRKGAPKFVMHDGPPYANGGVQDAVAHPEQGVARRARLQPHPEGQSLRGGAELEAHSAPR